MGRINQADIDEIERVLVWFRNARDEMAQLRQIQAAFWELLDLIESRDGWILTVFERDDDPRVHGAAWGQEHDVIYMSDDLYSMYCAHVGMVNENKKR